MDKYETLELLAIALVAAFSSNEPAPASCYGGGTGTAWPAGNTSDASTPAARTH